jgi:hypothetical protein
MSTVWLLCYAVLVLGSSDSHSSSSSSASFSRARALDIVRPFYDALSAGFNTSELLRSVVHDDWVSCGGNAAASCANQTAVTPFFDFVKSQVPDLRVVVVEQSVKGATVTTRAEISGTPQTPFLFLRGVTLANPRKSFRIMSIDVHELRGHKIQRSFHIENWLDARAQVAA